MQGSEPFVDAGVIRVFLPLHGPRLGPQQEGNPENTTLVADCRTITMLESLLVRNLAGKGNRGSL